MSTIIIVDDSLTVRMDLTEACEAAGFTCVPCATVAAARAALAKLDVSLAVLDVILPDGDGVQLLKEIRGNPLTANLPVLMLSTESEVADRVRGLKTGANDYVGKPYDTGYVVGRARELLKDARPSDERQTILLVDDSATVRAELTRVLVGAGYAVVTAASGEEALRLAPTTRPAAVVVDGAMPGMDGPTVIRGIRLDAALRTTPCILLTGADELGAETRALDAGADAFVRKDSDTEMLLARLAAVLRSAHASSSQAASGLGPKRILAVDDSATFLDSLAETLRVEGYDVVTARSGGAALELLAVQAVDCILLDLQMPGLDGIETCRRIKGSPIVRDTPLIIITDSDDHESMIEGLAAGADDYVPKSSELEVLRARVRAQIRRKSVEDENRRAREELLRKELEASEERAARQLAEAKAAMTEELARKNRELEAFSYSVSHDLRAPLRTIDGLALALMEDYGEQLDAQGKDYLERLRRAAERMNDLIEDLLELSRVSRSELRRSRVDLSELAASVVGELRRKDLTRDITVQIRPGMIVDGDGRLLRIVLENLVGNAWKFTGKTAAPRIDIGVTSREGVTSYFVRDNGAGFDMAHAARLFAPFQRLHAAADFVGTGIGLATVSRIIDRHGGRVWPEAAVGQGATFYFTLA